MEMTAFQRRAAVALLSLVAGSAMSAALAPAAIADSYVGAIAISDAAKVYGRAWDAPTKAAAQSAAMSACGQSDCKVLVTFTDCGAVAENATQYAGGYGATLAAAEASALANLQGGGGVIDVWACN